MDASLAGDSPPDGIPMIQVDQDQQHSEVQDWRPFLNDIAMGAPKSPSPGSVTAEDEWHLVSPNGSHRASRSSIAESEAGAASDHPSEASAQNEELANSVLTAPLEDAASAAHDEADDGLGADSLEALRSMSGLSQEGSLDGLSDADADEAAPTSPMADSGPGLPRAFAAHVTNALSDCCGVVAGQAGALGNWLLESVAAVVEAARMTPERMRAVLNAAAGQLWQLLPKRDAKEEQVAWGVVAAASGCVLMAATTVLTLVKNYKLRSEVLTRDRELAKLVMRVVSLQEVLQQSRHLPITRYTSYGGHYAHTCM